MDFSVPCTHLLQGLGFSCSRLTPRCLSLLSRKQCQGDFGFCNPTGQLQPLCWAPGEEAAPESWVASSCQGEKDTTGRPSKFQSIRKSQASLLSATAEAELVTMATLGFPSPAPHLPSSALFADFQGFTYSAPGICSLDPQPHASVHLLLACNPACPPAQLFSWQYPRSI